MGSGSSKVSPAPEPAPVSRAAGPVIDKNDYDISIIPGNGLLAVAGYTLLPKKVPTQVALLGSCDPTTWRTDIAIPMLEASKVTYFNPQVKEWKPEMLEIEANEKRTAQVLLFVIDNHTRAVGSIAEAAYYMSQGGRKVVLVVQEFVEGMEGANPAIAVAEYADLNRGRKVLRGLANDAKLPVFDTVEGGVSYCIGLLA